MKVLVTGATGFVGSHTVAALRAAGHDVRVFVRSPGKVAPTFAAIGVDPAPLEIAQGDLTDLASIGEALDGVDAVVHAASVYSLDPSDAEEMRDANMAGVRAVVGAAVARGLDPVVHVSSVVALLDERVVQDLSAESPVGTSKFPYSGSKAEQEAYVRTLQEEGAPVVCVYPGGVWGPDDPYDGESTQLLRTILAGATFFCPPGAVSIVDVRDVAAVIAAAMVPGQGPRRLMAGGHSISFRDLTASIAELAGVRRPTVKVPGGLVRFMGRLADRLAPRLSRELPLSAEGAWLSTKIMRADDTPTEAQLGVTFRPLDETLADQYRWQEAAGRA